MPEWLDKAKEAAKHAADAAKNVNLGAMIDKTKNMATQAAEEAKKAAGSIMKKDAPPTQPDIIPQQDNPQGSAQQPQATTPQAITPAAVQQVEMKIGQVEQLLQEIKTLLK